MENVDDGKKVRRKRAIINIEKMTRSMTLTIFLKNIVNGSRTKSEEK